MKEKQVNYRDERKRKREREKGRKREKEKGRKGERVIAVGNRVRRSHNMTLAN